MGYLTNLEWQQDFDEYADDERKVLLTLSKKFGQTIPLTRQELSELAGITHETVIRTLSRFKERGMISSSRGQTTLVRPKQLEALLGQL